MPWCLESDVQIPDIDFARACTTSEASPKGQGPACIVCRLYVSEHDNKQLRAALESVVKLASQWRDAEGSAAHRFTPFGHAIFREVFKRHSIDPGTLEIKS